MQENNIKSSISLSEDHKPDDDEETTRIYKANHCVKDNKVDGCLSVSRAFGDFEFKNQHHLKPEQ